VSPDSILPMPANTNQTVVMDDIVAVEVTLDTGERRYFLTWGRIQAKVDCEPPEALVLEHAGKFALGGTAVSASVCYSLGDASQETYFHECFAELASQRIPYGDGYERWRAERAAAMGEGRELNYCGLPR
jgi:hypothetical protein